MEEFGLSIPYIPFPAAPRNKRRRRRQDLDLQALLDGSFPDMNTVSQTVNASSVDWVEFKAWLDARYSAKHAGQLFLRATEYQAAAFDADKAAQLKAVSRGSRRYIKESLAALSKFTGTCEKWQAVKLQSGHFRHRSLRLSRYFPPRT
jgi:hypothetical protein